MKKVLILFCSVLCLIGCVGNNHQSLFTQQDVQTADVKSAEHISFDISEDSPINEKYRVDLNDIVSVGDLFSGELIDTMFFVPLQTTPESVIFEPDKIRISQDRIYIEDYKFNICIFDRKGNFVNSMTKGNGPGELQSVVAFEFDEKSHQLVVLQADKYFYYYDIDGHYLEKITRCPFQTHEFFFTDWGFLFYQSAFANHHLGDEAKYALLLTNENMKVLSKGVDVADYGFVRGGSMVFPGKDSIYVSQFLNDTIYAVSRYNKSDVEVKYILDYKKSKVVTDKKQEASKFYNNACVMENSQTQIFRFWSERNGMCHVVRDKSTGKTVGGTRVFSNPNVLPEYFGGLKTVCDDYFVSYIPSYKEMHFDSRAVSDADNQKIAGRDEEDNYVLAFFKFKAIK
jgi:hypothetical protein